MTITIIFDLYAGTDDYSPYRGGALDKGSTSRDIMGICLIKEVSDEDMFPGTKE